MLPLVTRCISIKYYKRGSRGSIFFALLYVKGVFQPPVLMPSIAHGNALHEGKDSQLRVMEMPVMGVKGLSPSVVVG